MIISLLTVAVTAAILIYKFNRSTQNYLSAFKQKDISVEAFKREEAYVMSTRKKMIKEQAMNALKILPVLIVNSILIYVLRDKKKNEPVLDKKET